MKRPVRPQSAPAVQAAIAATASISQPPRRLSSPVPVELFVSTEGERQARRQVRPTCLKPSASPWKSPPRASPDASERPAWDSALRLASTRPCVTPGQRAKNSVWPPCSIFLARLPTRDAFFANSLGSLIHQWRRRCWEFCRPAALTMPSWCLDTTVLMSSPPPQPRPCLRSETGKSANKPSTRRRLEFPTPRSISCAAEPQRKMLASCAPCWRERPVPIATSFC
jgi:hypothetical protein